MAVIEASLRELLRNLRVLCPFCFAKDGLCGFDYRKKIKLKLKIQLESFGGDGRQPKLRFVSCSATYAFYVPFASQKMDYAVSITAKNKTQAENTA